MLKLFLFLCLLVHVTLTSKTINQEHEEEMTPLLNQHTQDVVASMEESRENNSEEAKVNSEDIEVFLKFLNSLDTPQSDESLKNEKRTIQSREEKEEKKKIELFRLELAKKIRTKIMRDFLVNRYF